jgi:hypothetical protein
MSKNKDKSSDLSSVPNGLNPDTHFKLLEFHARLLFKTRDSASFHLSKFIPELEVYYGVGWIDIHYPCRHEGEPEWMFIRYSLPDEYMNDLYKMAIIDEARKFTGNSVIASGVSTQAVTWGNLPSVEEIRKKIQRNTYPDKLTE